MKPTKVRREDNFMDEIVETLKFVPKTRLRIVRDVVGALAEAAVRGKDGKTTGLVSGFRIDLLPISNSRTVAESAGPPILHPRAEEKGTQTFSDESTLFSSS